MSDGQTVLVIDTAMQGCGVAVFESSKDVMATAYNDDPQGQAQQLIPLVQEVLGKADIGFDDLTDVVVCNGPGTFTGIRIGISAAKTFGLTLGIPVWGITSLQALALTAVEVGVDEPMLGVVETRRQDFYVQAFDEQGMVQGESMSVMADDIDVGERALIGDAVQRFDPEGQCRDLGIKRVDVAVIAHCFVTNKSHCNIKMEI